MMYRVQAYHSAEKLKLREIRNRIPVEPKEFSNYEMVIQHSETSFTLLYNFGSIVFFNVADDVQARELSLIPELKAPGPNRVTDAFIVEVKDDGAIPPDAMAKVFFDRVVVSSLSYQVIKIVCMLLAESTALESYENLIENLLVQTNAYSKRLEKEGKIISGGEDFIKFIGMCLNTKQEIIANLYIVDSPDETWENAVLDRLHSELKTMLEVDTRYRALEYKIKIIQESLEVIVDLSKSKRETMLELTIILIIAFEAVLSVVKWTR